MGPIDCPETSVTNYQSTLRRISGELRSYLYTLTNIMWFCLFTWLSCASAKNDTDTVCVCVCACACVRVYACMYVSVYVGDVCMYVCMFLRDVFMYVCVCM